MKTILRVAAIGLLSAVTLIQVHAADWLTDLPKAQAQAKKEKKLVVMNFTGSDWCGWCIKFDKEVFATKAFADYARTNLVLVKLDFPQNTPQDPKLKQANLTLQNKYGVQGFPAIIVLKSDGTEAARQSGYVAGGPKRFIAWLEKQKKP